MRFPPPLGAQEPVVWNGRAFQVGDSTRRILAYEPEAGLAGWSKVSNAIYDTAVADHYIDVASRRNLVASLGQWVTVAKPAIIDIGCGSGLTLELMRRSFPSADLIGADYSQAMLEQAARNLPEMPLLRFDLARCPLPDGFVDVAVALNVLEHIEDDGAALGHIFRILRPGGVACIEVPAGPNSYDMYDMDLGHFRRYRARELTDRLQRAGFEILQRSHLGFLVFPAFWAMKQWNRRHVPAQPEKRKESIMRSIRASGDIPLMHRVMAVEAWLRKWMYLPFGVRCVVTCRRP